MDILFLIVAMVVVGAIMGFVAGLIWKEERPIGVSGDYIVAILAAVVMGLIDWFIIPALGFSDTMKWMGVLTEPALTALLVLWLIRVAKKNR
ncbi:MAG: hypothetical protein ACK2U1_12655 [Anaerolineales bacterium]|jgi:uncharacterized membrane protein YeaQ/YmgE (transglycosylase-associated protein family)